MMVVYSGTQNADARSGPKVGIGGSARCGTGDQGLHCYATGLGGGGGVAECRCSRWLGLGGGGGVV